jgi:undecaprenyl-diphosphatase
MSIIHIIILAAIQGLAELLPVSSSAHVILAQKIMGIDPSSPAMTFF